MDKCACGSTATTEKGGVAYCFRCLPREDVRREGEQQQSGYNRF